MKTRLPDYLKLFLFREGKVVLGRRFSNVWLLSLVLIATFLAIAFVNGSLNYLNFKMNDPFIKWVEVKLTYNNDSGPLERALADDYNKRTYNFGGSSREYENHYIMIGAADSLRPYLKWRFFDLDDNEDLVRAILKEDNRIEGITSADVPHLYDNCIGVFITEKALEQLGFKQAPAFIDYYANSKGADVYGFHTVNDRVRAPLPVLGVVKRLPGNVDVLSFTSLYRLFLDGEPLNMNNAEYASSLCYFVPDEIDKVEFDDRLEELLKERTDIGFIVDDQMFDPHQLYSYKNRIVQFADDGYPERYLGFRMVYTPDQTIPPLVCNAVNDIIMQEYAGKGVHRVFQYEGGIDPTSVDYLSIHFDDLKMIRPFVEDLVNPCELEVEMSQMNAKENFQSVSVMAIALSVVMIIFSVVCILLFLVNLLQSYFQKVKRNIGTFKAFGISNKELGQVYMTITLVLVSLSMLTSLLFVSIVQVFLNLIGLQKGDGFGILSLWKCDIISFFHPLITISAIVIVLVSTFITVRIVMKKLLSATPGDLIYDR